MSSSARSTRSALVAVVFALVVALSACGSGDGEDVAAPADSAPTAGGSTTIAHRFGETVVEAEPQRIVSLDPQWTDVLLSLDIVPVGYITSSYVEGGTLPWQGELLADSTPIPFVDEIPFEAIDELDPDLILGTYSIEESDYETLSKKAPTIPSITDAEVESWTVLAETAGTIFDRDADVDSIIADLDAQVAAVRSELPGLEGKTIAFVNYVPGSYMMVMSDPEDGANVLFADLGLGLAPGILGEAAGATGRVEVSLERLDLLDGDILVILTNGVEAEEIPGWNSIPATSTGAVAVVDMAGAMALNTPSPLSIPYGIEQIRPALETAAG